MKKRLKYAVTAVALLFLAVFAVTVGRGIFVLS